MPGRILYLHGLASSPRGRKATALTERFLRDGLSVVAPDLNVPSFQRLDFSAIVARAAEAARSAPPDVVVGSSLGSLVALALANGREVEAPLVLIAPALAFGLRWAERLPEGDEVDLYHHGEGRNLPIHRQFFVGMASVQVDEAPPPVPVTLVMGTADESVPFEQVRGAWERWEASGRLAAGSRFVRVDGGDHSLLEHLDVIEKAVRELAGAGGQGS